MTKDFRQTLERFQGTADITRALAAQMAELRKLREAVKKTEEAAARKEAKQRSREFIPRTGRRT